MDQDKEYTCKNCQGQFSEYIIEYDCQNCDDGITDNVRDIDFDGSGFCKCYVCKGSGTESYTETDFCCIECIKEHFETIE